jgi:transcriptional regulator with XRE-family HTH domain
MQALGTKIAAKRKDLGMTQIEFAEKLSVTRQTVSRWEAGTVMPDIDKISDIAELLGVSCDYLLKDDLQDEQGAAAPKSGISRLLEESLGRKVRLSFFD